MIKRLPASHGVSAAIDLDEAKSFPQYHLEWITFIQYGREKTSLRLQ